MRACILFVCLRSGAAVFTSRPTWLPIAVAAVPVIWEMASATAESDASSSSPPGCPIIRLATVPAMLAGTM